VTTSERIERDAVADFQRAAPAAFATAQGVEQLEIAGAVCTVFGAAPNLTLANRVVGLGLDEPATDEVFDTVEEFFGRRGARFMVAGDVPGLERRGYTRGAAWAIFERRSEPYEVRSGSHAVVEAGADRREEFGRVCVTGSGLPGFLGEWFGAAAGREGWHCFLAVDGDVPVGTGALYAEGGAGWLGFGATLAEHRGRGGQSAILAARIARAHELGLSRLVTSTGELVADRPSTSYRNIERAGFELAYVRPNWLSPAS
jgi:GNAT superfamily N-acetyltransferase